VREPAEVEAQSVGLVDPQIPEPAEPIVQRADQVAIQLDDIERADRGQESLRDGALTGADLDDAFAGCGGNRPVDTVDHLAVVKEVLSEALTCAVLH
jgi:hypothetical protein